MMVRACDLSTQEEIQEVHKLEAYLGSLMQLCLRKKEGEIRMKKTRENERNRRVEWSLLGVWDRAPAVSLWCALSPCRPWVCMGLSPKPQCQEPRTPAKAAEMSRLQMQVLKNWVESSSVKEMSWPGSLGAGNSTLGFWLQPPCQNFSFYFFI